MTKIGKGLLYLNFWAVLFVGVLDDIHINVAAIYGFLFQLDQLLLPLMFFDKKRSRLLQYKPVLAAIGVWLIYSLGTAILSGVSILPVLGATISFFSGMILLLGSVVFLDRTDLKRGWNFLKFWYVLNLLLSIVEFAFFEKRDDMLGGFIGCRMGSNAYMNLIHCALLIGTLVESLFENKLKPYTAFAIFSTIFLASLQELKFFYYEYLLILLAVIVICVVQKRTSLKTVGLVLLLAAVSIGISLYTMKIAYPKHYALLVGQRSYETYEKITRFPYAISRAHFIPEIDELWFHGDVMKNLFGLGFGGGHPGTAFFEANESMHYLYFTHQTLFLESGLIGLGLFLLIFAVIALQFGWNFLRNRPMTMLQTYGSIFALILMMNVFYNNAFISKTTMLLWPLMAVPFITQESR